LAGCNTREHRDAPKDTMRRPTLPGLGEGCHGSDVVGRQVRSASRGWWVSDEALKDGSRILSAEHSP
jgi:hypothetical protein